MLIEARLTWGGDVLAVAHTRARDLVRLSDFALTGFEDDAAIVADAGRLWCDAVQRGSAIIRFTLVDDAEELPFGELGEFRTTKGVLLAAALHATMLVIAFLGQAAPNDDEQLATMRSYLAASDARSLIDAETIADPESPNDDVALAMKSDLPASPLQPRTDGPTARPHGSPVVDPVAARNKELADAREFGMVHLLAAADAAAKKDNLFLSWVGPMPIGSTFGPHVYDGADFGGAPLSGIGIGGGGSGAGVGLDFVAPMFGTKLVGVALSQGRLHGEHGVRTITIGCRCGSTQVNGRLPPEVIQRIVRQNFGRMRQCYESTLFRQPTLEGRIAVKFVIDRSGAVATASANESSFSDSSVDACVVRAFQDMSFPQPEGGIVTVVYPVTFSVSG